MAAFSTANASSPLLMLALVLPGLLETAVAAVSRNKRTALPRAWFCPILSTVTGAILLSDACNCAPVVSVGAVRIRSERYERGVNWEI